MIDWDKISQNIPQAPGVYTFKKQDTILYIGKAKNLKKRILQYKETQKLSLRIKKMVETATSIEFKVLKSEIQALLTEAYLIQLHKPFFNILLKDDKSPIYIGITNQEFPRVLLVRKKQLINSKQKYRSFFGPFYTKKHALEILKISRRIFKWCNKHPKDFKTPCFYYQIDLCDGACIGKVNKQQYEQKIKNLETFLKGETEFVIKSLEKQIKKAADNLDFETAIELKKSFVLLTDIAKNKITLDPLLDITIPIFEKKYKTHIKSFEKILNDIGFFKKNINRIEGYDVSNINGKNATVSMVVLQNFDIAKKEYRLFNIKAQKPNDFNMLKIAIKRRQKHSEWAFPDIMLIDGGRGQVKAVLSILDINTYVLGIKKRPKDTLVIPVKINNLVYSQWLKDKQKIQNISFLEIPLKQHILFSNLIKIIRDESHRFAKKQHIRLRNRNFLNLDQ